MTKELKAAVLGAGYMAGVHTRCLTKIPGIQIAAICDVQTNAAEKLIADCSLQNCKVYSTHQKMLEEIKPDVLYVCIPPFAQKGQVQDAAERGIHLFLEKPIAFSLKDAQSMAAAIAKNKVICQVGYHMRFGKAVSKLRELVINNKTGKPTLMQGRFWCNFDGSAWWRDKTKSGGQIYEQLIHLFDLALHFFGKPKSVSAVMNNLCHQNRKDYTIEDVSASTIVFENGSIASITGSNCALPGRFIGDFRICFEKAVLDYTTTGDWRDKDQPKLHVIQGAEISTEQFTEDASMNQAEDEDFIQAVRTQGKNLTPVTAGVDSIRLVTLALQSASKNGKTINW